MKKLLAIVSAIALLVGISACTTTPVGDTPTASPVPQSSVAPPTSAPTAGLTDRPAPEVVIVPSWNDDVRNDVNYYVLGQACRDWLTQRELVEGWVQLVDDVLARKEVLDAAEYGLTLKQVQDIYSMFASYHILRGFVTDHQVGEDTLTLTYRYDAAKHATKVAQFSAHINEILADEMPLGSNALDRVFAAHLWMTGEKGGIQWADYHEAGGPAWNDGYMALEPGGEHRVSCAGQSEGQVFLTLQAGVEAYRCNEQDGADAQSGHGWLQIVVDGVAYNADPQRDKSYSGDVYGGIFTLLGTDRDMEKQGIMLNKWGKRCDFAPLPPRDAPDSTGQRFANFKEDLIQKPTGAYREYYKVINDPVAHTVTFMRKDGDRFVYSTETEEITPFEK